MVQRTWKAVRIVQCLALPNSPHIRVRARAWWFVPLVVLSLTVHLATGNRAIYADQSHSEDQIKAAYLFNFLKFVEWPSEAPADPQGRWVIGIIGDSSVGVELKRLAERKSVEGRELLVRKFRVTDNLRGCNVLFLSASEQKHLQSILGAVDGASVLTVADMDNFIARGGMIQFVEEGDRVRVDIDVGATGRAHLKVSSKLLALAEAVTETVRSAHN